VCPTWTIRSITGDNTTWDPSPTAGSGVFDSNTVVLNKPDPGNARTEASTADAGLDLTNGTITVHYDLPDGAWFTTGAVRLFYYHATGANTLTDAPTASVAADNGSLGTMTISGVTGHVGTLGLVYDASNSSGAVPGRGAVVFSGLTAGDTPVKFNQAGCPPSPSPSTTGGGVQNAPVPTPVTANLPVTG
jgi:hypothetical protein